MEEKKLPETLTIDKGHDQPIYTEEELERRMFPVPAESKGDRWATQYRATVESWRNVDRAELKALGGAKRFGGAVGRDAGRFGQTR